MKNQWIWKTTTKKQPISIFAAHNFLMFLNTQMHEPKICDKTVSEYYGSGVLVFSGEIFSYSEEFGSQKTRGWYYKVTLNGSEGVNKIFGLGSDVQLYSI